MPIYARNSLGSDVKITANENYSFADMGRILSECVQNDQTLFNAVLMNDFKESTAIREGTMVSSELQTFREASVKEAWAGLKAKLKKLWEKIKGVFRQVYSTLTVWLVRNGKAFVAMHRKTLANKTGLDSCKIPVFVRLKKDPSIGMSSLVSQANNFKTGWKTNKRAEETSSETFLNELLSSVVHDGTTADNFNEEFKKTYIEETKDTTYGSIKSTYSYEKLFDKITSKSDSIKKLKDMEKKADSAIKAAMNAISAVSKEEKEGKDYKNASAQVSAFERAITLTTRAGIQAIRSEVSNARQIIGRLVAYSPKSENAIYEEMAWLEGADDFATVDDIPAEEVNADDVQSDPDVEINVTVDDDGNECSK